MTRRRCTKRRGVGRAGRLLAALALCLALGVFSAAAWADVAPGCNPDMWEVLKTRAQANRVRDKAYTKLIQPTDSSLATTCFDKALALSARLGAIFSDRAPGAIPPPNYSAYLNAPFWGTNVTAAQALEYTYNIYAGLGVDTAGNPKTLANAYKSMMMNSGDANFAQGGGLLEAYFDPSRGADPAQFGNFAGAISTNLGATVTGTLENYVSIVNDLLADMRTGSLDGILDIKNPVGNISMNFSLSFEGSFGWGGLFLSYALPEYAAAFDTVVSIVDMYNSIQDMVTQVSNFIGPMVDGVTAFVTNLTDMVEGQMFLAAASMSGVDWGALRDMTDVSNDGCQAIARLWNGGVDAGGNVVAGIEGGGPARAADMPFLTFEAFISGAGGGEAFAAQVGHVDNANILEQARNDQIYRLGYPYSQTGNPDGLRSWKMVPVVSGLGTADIISMMDPPEGP